jgi:MtN3 and saliva related transmembrane protein
MPIAIPTAVAVLAPLMSCVQLIPQMHKTWRTKRVEHLSFLYLVLMLVTDVLWIAHGYFNTDHSLIISGGVVLTANFVLLAMYLTYR